MNQLKFIWDNQKKRWGKVVTNGEIGNHLVCKSCEHLPFLTAHVVLSFTYLLPIYQCVGQQFNSSFVQIQFSCFYTSIFGFKR